ncbi:glycoside hydrolase family 5 protein [Myriangium duriaei CBS 260.36]|uniref:mannan endo-1,4-beta-mannosidase n=1 Tax=Myriangium duriaei CBS 260.36 TaxID=1168546 RepID=A0A9P4J0A2_9PEZI|nr:glycoside hydrolase family 5 protein [Myriangium duriaei CBS 260.36]
MKLTSYLAPAALALFSLPIASTQNSTSSGSFSGSNLYYAAGLTPAQQVTLLSGLQSAGVKVLRVWLDGQSGTTKGTQINSFPGLEGNSPGAYDDTVLERLDDFMAVANTYCIKLLISIHSYNTLAANGDYYGKWYGIGDFYTDNTAMGYFKDRITHVLNHTNPHNGKTWAESSEYIFAFEAQNEAMHDQANPTALQSWQCTMATAIKSNLPNDDILVTTGGGGFLSNSLLDGYFTCPALDVLAIHAYGVSDFSTSALTPYVTHALSAGKKLIMQEWGSCYTSASNNNCNGGSTLDAATRGANIKKWSASIAAAGVPQFYWQVLPNEDPHQGWDYEVGIDGVNWEDLKTASLAAAGAKSAFDFGRWLI